MQKYVALFRNYVSASLEYRAELFINLLFKALTIGSIFLIWFVIYDKQKTVAGYHFIDIIVYYLLVPFPRLLTQMDIAQHLGNEIKNGFFSNYLLKPYSLWLSQLIQVFASRIRIVVLLVPVYIIVFTYLSLRFHYMVFSLQGLLIASVLILGAIVLGTFLDLLFAYLAFWVDDVWAFQHAKNIMFGVFAGTNFPFVFVPQQYRGIFEFLPFKFLCYIPVSYLQEKRTGNMLFMDIVQLLAWIIMVFLLGTIVWKKGLKKYDAFGR